jgi:hypothetical protein
MYIAGGQQRSKTLGMDRLDGGDFGVSVSGGGGNGGDGGGVMLLQLLEIGAKIDERGMQVPLHQLKQRLLFLAGNNRSRGGSSSRGSRGIKCETIEEMAPCFVAFAQHQRTNCVELMVAVELLGCNHRVAAWTHVLEVDGLADTGRAKVVATRR